MDSKAPAWISESEAFSAFVEELQPSGLEPLDKVIARIEEAIKVADHWGHVVGKGVFRTLLVKPVRELGDLDRAVALGEEAVAILKGESTKYYAEALLASAKAKAHAGAFMGAFEEASQATYLAEGAEDGHLYVEASSALAYCYSEARNYEKSAPILAELIEQHRDHMSDYRYAKTVNNLSRALMKLGKYYEAAETAKVGFDFLTDRPYKDIQAFLLTTLASSLAARRKFTEAQECAASAEQMFRASKKKSFAPVPQLEMGSALLKSGQFQRAVKCLEQALDLSKSTPGDPFYREICERLAETYGKLGRFKAASEVFAMALETVNAQEKQNLQRGMRVSKEKVKTA